MSNVNGSDYARLAALLMLGTQQQASPLKYAQPNVIMDIVAMAKGYGFYEVDEENAEEQNVIWSSFPNRYATIYSAPLSSIPFRLPQPLIPANQLIDVVFPVYKVTQHAVSRVQNTEVADAKSITLTEGNLVAVVFKTNFSITAIIVRHAKKPAASGWVVTFSVQTTLELDSARRLVTHAAFAVKQQHYNMATMFGPKRSAVLLTMLPLIPELWVDSKMFTIVNGRHTVEFPQRVEFDAKRPYAEISDD
jgi:hypothetical protein